MKAYAFSEKLRELRKAFSRKKNRVVAAARLGILPGIIAVVYFLSGNAGAFLSLNDDSEPASQAEPSAEKRFDAADSVFYTRNSQSAALADARLSRRIFTIDSTFVSSLKPAPSVFGMDLSKTTHPDPVPSLSRMSREDSISHDDPIHPRSTPSSERASARDDADAATHLPMRSDSLVFNVDLMNPENTDSAILEAPAKISSDDFSRGRASLRNIALTFDGGSLDNAVDEILRMLDSLDVRATMFLTGRFIQNYPESVLKIVARGHEIGNHTWSHPHLTSFAVNRRHGTLPNITSNSIQNELRRTREIYQQLVDTDMQPIWRSPYGEHNLSIRRWAAEIGFRHIGWTTGKSSRENLDTMDWVADTTSSLYRTPGEILDKFRRLASDSTGGALKGGIVLMHLGTQRVADQFHPALPEIIALLRNRGYAFVTISEMLRLTEHENRR